MTTYDTTTKTLQIPTWTRGATPKVWTRGRGPRRSYSRRHRDNPQATSQHDSKSSSATCPTGAAHSEAPREPSLTWSHVPRVSSSNTATPTERIFTQASRRPGV